ncbi:hypothetical protein ACTFBT_01300 [Streptomyces microflavus]|uniref:Uncharacterized protein n=1 Tax=Streptomyces microflavus TaxID=1919 RepID=A0A7J0D4B1_STRMI|nr:MULTISPECIES: hypothetical protein [Streptomyces]MDX2978137.1 hypothetical protein [Streptomyces sp. NRRL_B-2249]GFN09573.1 hypothetical protein Smic_81290 [Streptomyces microflavus]GGX67056.1 hypothetical protein GCM10010298_34720 [Streptomyces microflavus]
MSLIANVMSQSWFIERPGARVRDSTGSWVAGPPVRTRVDYCAVMSPYGVTVGSSTEQHDASETVTTRRVFAAPLGTDVRPSDRIVSLDGSETWEVVGRPLILPLTSLARVEAALKEVTG